MSTDARHRQDGDLRDLGPIRLDLTTCVNPYGPPGAVVQALRGMSADAIRRHPYGAAEDVEAAYARYTEQPVTEFVAGRGASDLIWTLARHLNGKSEPRKAAGGSEPAVVDPAATARPRRARVRPD